MIELILNFLTRRFKIFILSDFVLIIILICLFILGNILFVHIEMSVPILIPNSNLQVTHSELSHHNSNLISTLQERESYAANGIYSEIGGFKQTRSIYIGIIGVLLVFIFGKNGRNKTYIVLLSLIILFYGLDIHLNDMINRSIIHKKVTSDALEFIVMQTPTDSIWYNINYDNRKYQYDKMHDTRIGRKIKAIFHPEFAQWVFFIIPFLIIYFILTREYREKSNAT